MKHVSLLLFKIIRLTGTLNNARKHWFVPVLYDLTFLTPRLTLSHSCKKSMSKAIWKKNNYDKEWHQQYHYRIIEHQLKLLPTFIQLYSDGMIKFSHFFVPYMPCRNKLMCGSHCFFIVTAICLKYWSCYLLCAFFVFSPIAEVMTMIIMTKAKRITSTDHE